MNPNVYLDPLARCESRSVGSGTRIWANAHVMEGATIGKNCNLGEGVFVESGVVIGDGCTIKNGVALWDRVTLENDVFVGPNVVFTNDYRPRAFLKRGASLYRPTLVKRGATLGANSTLVCGVTIGSFAFVGAASVVNRDVEDHEMVVGNPVRALGFVCFCGAPLKESLCIECNLSLKDNSVEAVQKRIQPLKDNS